MSPPVSAAAFQFRDQFYALVPPWLRTGNGEKYLYPMETARDLLCEKAYQAVTIRLPGVGDSSNLAYLAEDRKLVQGPAESNAAFALRLQNAFSAWAKAGSALAVIGQLQAYMQALQPGVPAGGPMVTIVGNYAAPPRNTWNQVYQDTPIGAPPSISPGQVGFFLSNFDWDGDSTKTWRNWLILPMALAPVMGLSGSSASTTTAAPSACFTSPGHTVGGVWVPAPSGTPVNSPWLTITGLSGLTAAQGGQWLTLSGSSNAGNNGTFPISQVLSPSSCVVANPRGVTSDAGPLAWTVGVYPWIGPGPVYGMPGNVWGQGELTIPPIDTGARLGGVWQPTPALGSGVGGAPLSWGLSCSADVIDALRSILARWKSAGTYYANIIIAFDCADGSAGSAFSPLSEPGSGNPDGSFGSVGELANGVWIPTRGITSPYNAYCQGTGSCHNCSVENIT